MKILEFKCYKCPNCNEVIVLETDGDDISIINCNIKNLHNNNYEVINSKNIEFG
ncbi:hypothetical protein [Clostridium botulinum]|uniref:hypothetical protein n=1 Tax=Clostridium botulinum TaxID=1491 RepID=UPI00174E7F68|nr:hypothetical protein [Clostridium botulinum]MBD5589183.1 hypothetical protein [Clostridium botulinum]